VRQPFKGRATWRGRSGIRWRPITAAFLVDFLAERTGFGEHAFEMFKRLFSRFLSRVPPVLFGRRQLAFKWNCDELNSCRDSPARFLVGVEEFPQFRICSAIAPTHSSTFCALILKA
jgi:hypothetical protein